MGLDIVLATAPQVCPGGEFVVWLQWLTPRGHSLLTATLSLSFPLTSEPLHVEKTEDGGSAKGYTASCP